MYSIIQAKGFQNKVSLGEVLRLPTLDIQVGTTVAFENVLLFNDGQTSIVGLPEVAGAKIEAEVLCHGKGDKVLVFRRKRRKGMRRLNGHRQPFTEVVITRFSCGAVDQSAPGTSVESARRRAKAYLARVASGTTPRLTRKEKIAKAQAV
ncbi:MAG: ribosomal protein [Fibrobacterota bacterium]|jgi:large subunit ribosomal protein L21